jgi:hypothetical protein
VQLERAVIALLWSRIDEITDYTSDGSITAIIAQDMGFSTVVVRGLARSVSRVGSWDVMPFKHNAARRHRIPRVRYGSRTGRFRGRAAPAGK